jgi:hypothetical protein
VAREQGEHGVVWLQQAWTPLDSINLVGFDYGVLSDPRLVEALQQQADKDCQTVRLVKFVRAEESLEVRPRQQT